MCIRDRCLNVVKFVRREIGEIVRYLSHKKNNKISAASLTVSTACISPKICQGQPPTFGSHYSRFYTNRFTFGGIITERVNAVLLLRRVFPWFARIEASLRANNKRIAERHVKHLGIIVLRLMYGVKAGDAETDSGCHGNESSHWSQHRLPDKRYIAAELATLATVACRTRQLIAKDRRPFCRP